MALPGSVYVYQGEELGLWEVQDIPDDRRQDPIWHRTNGEDTGRDGCRVPLPWSGDEPPFGFSPEDATAGPWLPQPAAWAANTAQAQAATPGSVLELYREALRLRRAEAALHTDDFGWLAPDDGAVLDFARGGRFRCLVNLSGQPVPLPEHSAILLASGPLAAPAELPANTAVWLRTS